MNTGFGNASMKQRLAALVMVISLLVIVVPAPVPGAQRPGQRRISDAVIRAAIIQELGDPGAAGATLQFLSGYADLNGDGQTELLVWVPTPNYGGTSGYPLLIFGRLQRRLQLVSRIEQAWTPLILLRTSTHGWRDLVMQVGGGGEPMRRVRFHYDGANYPERFSYVAANRVRGRTLIVRDWQNSVVGPLPRH